MDQPDIAPAPACRHDGWTPERQALFLEHLAGRGNVRAACARVGMSREAAYRLRRREPLFARGWDTALLLAREGVAETLGDRAMDGIEEAIWYRGELVGTRRRYDTRLLLAHMARLDKLAERQASFGKPERFDELLGCIAGEPGPDEACEEGELPPERHDYVCEAVTEAKRRVEGKWADKANAEGELEDEAYAAYKAEFDAEVERAALEAVARWDEWRARAIAAADTLLASDAMSGTVSNVSTSPAGAGPLSPAAEEGRTG